MKTNEEERRWIFTKQFTGALAMWAVRQSPYAVPERLEHAIYVFNTAVDHHYRPVAGVSGLAHLTRKEVSVIFEALFHIPEIVAWNNRKNGRQGMGFVSIFDGPRSPDDDFIDLDALRRNCIATVWEESACETRTTDNIFRRLRNWLPCCSPTTAPPDSPT